MPIRNAAQVPDTLARRLRQTTKRTPVALDIVLERTHAGDIAYHASGLSSSSWVICRGLNLASQAKSNHA